MATPAATTPSAATAQAAAPAAAGPQRFAKLRKATDRVPTKWFAAIGTAGFLAVTAAFGSLAPVEVEATPLAQLAGGETHTSAQLSTTVERAVLIDALPGSGVTPDREAGERLLVLLVTLENQWTRPLASSARESFAGAVRLAGDDRRAQAVVREDDQTSPLWLQPGVPALLAYTWTVGPDDYHGGDDLTVVIDDPELIVGQMLYTGEDWGDYRPAAEVTISIDDVGAGGAQ